MEWNYKPRQRIRGRGLRPVQALSQDLIFKANSIKK
jgi:hypothetical protein